MLRRLDAYLTLGTLQTVASIVGIGSGATSLFGNLFGHKNTGGNQNNQSALSGGPQQYVPTGLGAADQSWQQALQQMIGGAGGAAAEINPALLAAFQQLMGVDTSGLQQAGLKAGQAAGDTAGQYGNIAAMLQQQGIKDWGGQNALMGAGNQLWQTAQDPQNALAARLQQQVTDASRAGTSARGIGMSGNAAGIENQAVSNFLMDWQNQQLQRQAMGLQGMGQAYGQGGQLGQQGNASMAGSAELSGMIPGMMMQTGSLPYGANVQAAGAPMNYANMFSGAQGNTNNSLAQILQSIIPYMNSGQGAVNSQFGQNQVGLNNLTTGLQQFGQNAPSAWSALSNLFSGGGTGGWGGNQTMTGTVPYDQYGTGDYGGFSINGP